MYMMKFKAMPDVGILILRLIVGLVIVGQLLFSISQVWASITTSHTLIIPLIVLGLGSLLLALGLWTRWATAAVIIYYVVSGVMYMTAGQPTSALLVTVLPTLAPYLAIFFAGGGKYSLDHKFYGKK